MGDPDLFLLGFLLRLFLLFNLSQCLWRLGVRILGIVVLWEKRTILFVCLFVEEHIPILVLCETRTILIVFFDYRNFAHNLTSSTTTFTDWVMQNVILDVLANWDLSFDNQLLLRRKILMF